MEIAVDFECIRIMHGLEFRCKAKFLKKNHLQKLGRSI